jgi:hypothetical protein
VDRNSKILFGFVKNQLREQRYETTEAIQKECVSVFGWLERNFTEGVFSNSQNAGRNVYKEVGIMWKNKERSVDLGGVFGLSIMKHVTLQKIVAHDFRYDPRISSLSGSMAAVFYPSKGHVSYNGSGG